MGPGINGLTTVRAFDAINSFILKSEKNVDDWTRAQMAQQASPRWLGMRVPTYLTSPPAD